MTRFGADELMQRSGDIPTGMSFIVKGRVRLVVMGKDGGILPFATLHEGDFIGQTALTREPVTGSAYAIGEVSVLQVPRDTLEHLIFRKPELLQDLSQAIDDRRARARAVAAEADKPVAETEDTDQDAL